MGKAGRISTIAEAFQRTVERHAERSALKTLDERVSLTWGEVGERVNGLAAGFRKLGLARNDRVALLLGRCPEFHIADLASMQLGATPFSLYETLAPEQIRYVVSDAAPRLAVVEAAQLDRFLEATRDLLEPERVVVVGEAARGRPCLEEIEASAPEIDVREAWREVKPEDLLTLIYTSGTTGPPKGVQLTHRNLVAAARALEEIIRTPDEGRVISWLPAAHIAERAAHHYLPIVFGFTVTCCPNPRELSEALAKVRPTWFFAVPRVWEKMKAGIEARLTALPEEARDKATGALQAAVEKVRREQAGQKVPDELVAHVARAEEELFSKLRAVLGLDQAVVVNVGAAPTPVEVLEFFHAIGIELAELWGMSETSGVGTANRPGQVRIGTVGPPSLGVEIRLDSDGEILVRGECVMTGYRNQPEKTAEVLDAERWLRTGDIGAIDADGYLRIVDRKKELIINAAGKNMSPSSIECALKAASPLIGQACVIGDRRSYNTALIVLDADYLPVWADGQGLGTVAPEALAEQEIVVKAVQAAVDEANAKLSRVEQIKKFTLFAREWPAGGDELTPTMKLKRKPIAEKYASEIERMYAP